MSAAMEVLLFCCCVVFAAVDGAVAENHPKFKDSYLEHTMVEDVVPDLAGRRRLIVRDPDTDQLSVFWVTYDRESKLPFVQDPSTSLPYLLLFKEQKEEIQLYRMWRGKDHRFIVTDPEVEKLYRPVLNRLGEVDLEIVSEEEAGFTRKDVIQL